MILYCSSCGLRHDTAGRRPGEAFACRCSHSLVVPSAGPKKGATWLVVAVVFAAIVPIVILAAIAIPNFLRYGLKSKAGEARVNLQSLRVAEADYFGVHGTFLAAGPVPARVPRALKEEFVGDEGFQALNFKPEGRVYYQYQARVTGPETVSLFARGDLNGDGVTSEFRLNLDRADFSNSKILEKDPYE